jgi:hypothetical protein
LLKLRHRDVVKASIDKMRNSSQSASSNFKVKREQNRLKKEERVLTQVVLVLIDVVLGVHALLLFHVDVLLF